MEGGLKKYENNHGKSGHQRQLQMPDWMLTCANKVHIFSFANQNTFLYFCFEQIQQLLPDDSFPVLANEEKW